MRRVPVAPAAHLFLALLASTLLAAPGRSQSRRIVEVPKHGIDVFANLLHLQQLQPIQSIQELEEAVPARTILIVLGRLECLGEIERVVGGLPAFLKKGGAVLIASDFPTGGKLSAMGLSISGRPVVRPQHDSFLEEYRLCPILPLTPGHIRKHPLFRDAEEAVVAGRPSAFTGIAPGFEALAVYPGNAREYDSVGPGTPAMNSPWMVERTFFSGKTFGPRGHPERTGTLIAMTGHGLFLNCFLVQREFNNFLLARNMARYLAEAPNGEARTHVLLLEDGVPVRKLDLSLTTSPFPIGPALNIFIDQIQRRGIIEDFISSSVPRRTMWYWGLVSISALAVPLAFRRLLRTRFQRDVRSVLTVGLHDPGPPPMPLLRQRQDQLLKQDNHAEPARILARQWLSLQRGQMVERMPGYAIDASWWRRRRLKGHLEWVARLVGSSPLGHVRARDLSRLGQTLRELSQSLRSGEIRFFSESASSTKEG